MSEVTILVFDSCPKMLFPKKRKMNVIKSVFVIVSCLFSITANVKALAMWPDSWLRPPGYQ
jgi:hypothetical protein